MLRGYFIYNNILQCIDLAKAPRAPDPMSKSKSKSKNDKGKAETTLQYDYEEGSVHDGAIHARIMKGYEGFKVSRQFFCLMID